MANEFVIKNGFISNGDSIVNGSLSAQTLNISSLTSSIDDTKVLTIDDNGVVHTVPISGLTENTYITGFTYNGSNTFILSDNSGRTFNATVNTLTGLTINGDLTVTGKTNINLVSATGLTVDYIDFNLLANPVHKEGRIHWSDAQKTLDIDTDVNGFMVEVGHMNVVRVVNKTNTTLLKGELVWINGAQGQRPTVTRADYSGDSTSARTLGFVAQNINNNNNGYVITYGMLRDVNTLPYSAGTQLYLYTGGTWTNIRPVAPKHEVRVGVVVDQNATTGIIFVSIMNGYELTELHDVSATTVNNLDVLQWSSLNNVWQPTSNPKFNSISATTYYNLPFYDAGILSNYSGWSNNGNGSMNLPQVQVGLYDNPNYTPPLRTYTVSSGVTGSNGISGLTNNDTNYIYIEYNGGNPRWVVSTDDSAINGSNVVRFQTVYRIGNFIHNLEWGNEGTGLPNKIANRIDSVSRFARESGLSLGLSGSTGVVTLSSGVAWNGTLRQSLASVNSQDDIFFQNFHSGGTWVISTTADTLNNLYYDNGTDRVLASGGTYLVNWYYRGQEINDHLYEVLGNTGYTSVSEARLSTEPNLPELITSHAFLLGRIIVQKGSLNGIVETAFTQIFQPTTVQEHNDLTGLQGGTSGEYYHLNSNQYNNIALTNTNNNFSTSQTINGDLNVIGQTTSTIISGATYLNLPTYFSYTYSNLNTLKSNSGLTPGSLYKITDRSNNLGIFIRATSTTEFSTEGFRLMYVPTTYVNGLDSGLNWLGVWNSTVTPSIGDVCIWGARVWQNLSGNTGSFIDEITLDSEWSELPFSASGAYDVSGFVINYDFDSDWIVNQTDGKNNIGNISYNDWTNLYGFAWNPCDRTDWNYSKYSPFSNNSAIYILNNSGVADIIYNECQIIYNNNSTRIFKNRCQDISGNITFDIKDNIGIVISSNNISGNIEGNKVREITGNITSSGNIEKNEGYVIANNTVNSSIFNNFTTTITNNTNTNISDNHCGLINNNTGSEITGNYCTEIINNDARIRENYCLYIGGNICNNIDDNHCGEVNSNNIPGFSIVSNHGQGVNSNSNQGDITGNYVLTIGNNTNIGAIISNYGGTINNNANNGTISYNKVDQIIDNPSNGLTNIVHNEGVLISNNLNTGFISGNTVTKISSNSNTGNIHSNKSVEILSNTNLGDIRENHTDYILNNSNQNGITYNYCASIDNNSNTDWITENYVKNITGNLSNVTSIVGNYGNDISANDNTGHIRYNNLTQLSSNTNLGDIENNQGGEIISNDNGGDIKGNIIKFRISGNILTGQISYNDCDDIIDNLNFNVITGNKVRVISYNTITGGSSINNNVGTSIQSNICGTITRNYVVSIDSNGSNVTNIESNIGDSINNNDNIGWIKENKVNFLRNNTITGNIQTNDCEYIQDNGINVTLISGNKSGIIETNNNLGSIINNTTRNIQSNINIGSIENNTGDNIQANENNGNILNNVVRQIITNSSNVTNITNNNSDNIQDNQNSGIISYNDVLTIVENINIGDISENQCISISANTNNGNIIRNAINGNIKGISGSTTHIIQNIVNDDIDTTVIGSISGLCCSTLSGVTNIYNSDGVLTGNRTLNGSNNFLRYENLSFFETIYSGFSVGLFFDFVNDIYNFGDINNKNGGTGIQIFSQLNNDDRISLFANTSGIDTTIFDIDATNKYIKTSYQNNDIGLKLDFANSTYSLGDFNNTSGNTKIVIDDTAQTITLSNISAGTDTRILTSDSNGVIRYRNFSDFSGATSGGGTLSGNYLPLSGGTVTGNTIFQQGLTANTISGGTIFGDGGNLTNVVTSITAGSGLSGNSTNGNITLINTSPDKTVTVTGGTNIQIVSDYPNFGINFTGFPSTIQYYAEPSTAPTIKPKSTATGAISIGDSSESNNVNGLSIGSSAGSGSTNSISSILIGSASGFGMKTSLRAISIGDSAAYGAQDQTHSVMIGTGAGQYSIGTLFGYSNFIGYGAGANSQTNQSNFIGLGVGSGAIDSEGSTFIGKNTGTNTTGMTGSILMGIGTGGNVLNSKNSILIGNSITIPNNTPNLMNLGGILFGSGVYSGTSTSSLPSSTGRIGIGVNAPTNRLHIEDTSDPLRIVGLQVLNTDSQVVTTDTNGVIHKRTYDFVTGLTYNNQNRLSVNTTVGSYTATINQMTGLTVTGDLTVTGNYIVSGDTIISGNTLFSGTTTLQSVPNAIGDFLTLPSNKIVSKRTSDQVRDDIGYYGLTFAITNGYF